MKFSTTRQEKSGHPSLVSYKETERKAAMWLVNS
jgi:hypothetical protein